jgi:ATP-dependent DNA helicase RecG
VTRQKVNAPEFAETLGKILALEHQRGYNNRAVQGGLDRFREFWQAEMAARAYEAPDAPFLLLQSYAEMTAEQRTAWVSQWLALIQDGAPEAAASSLSSTIQPEPPAPPMRAAPPFARPASVLPEPVEGRSSSTSSKPRPAFAVPSEGRSVDDPVGQLKGVDVKTAARLERLDVATVRDLLYLFPRRHEDYSSVVSVSEIVPGQECTAIATVWESRVVAQGPKGRRKDTEAVLGDETGNVRAIWFGQQYIARTLKPGARIAISGKPDVFRGQPVFNSPAAYPVGSEAAAIHTGRLAPVYPLTEGLRLPALRNLTWLALQGWLGGVEETLPDTLREGRMPLPEAIFQAHYPDSPEAWQVARSRLAFDELLTLQLAMQSRRRNSQSEIHGIAVNPMTDVAGRFLRSLPFELTRAQARCIAEIAEDMAKGSPPMNRLLQGEVGSGKTVVALAALLATAAAGFQGALMAPTEVLAEQHFRSALRLLDGRPRQMDEDHLFSVSLEGMEREGMQRPVTIGLLTGSVRAREKRMLTAMAADGTLDLAIGTQALIQEGVSLPNLALAIADEQHRFGVMQRSALRRRGGENPHTLIMSATPIPRTLSLTLYGDLDISTIDELPVGRQSVRTRLVAPENREAAYGFVRKQVQEGRQAFVVCPLIEESASIEARAATDEYERLSGQVFPDLRVGLLHGRMHSRDKDAVLRSFGYGGFDVLVTTAVVEVGIDVPNATIMLIEGAERFGLAQLHQFRGRVGRGEHRSYCLLLPSETQGDMGVSAKERLSALERTHDGFELAEIDLELRGPGDFFGTRQSGLPNLRMARFSDRGLLESARELAAHIASEDPELSAPQHAALAAQVARFTSRADADAS